MRPEQGLRGTSRVFLGLLGFPGVGNMSPKTCGITAVCSHAVVGVNTMVVVVNGSMVSMCHGTSCVMSAVLPVHLKAARCGKWVARFAPVGWGLVEGGCEGRQV